MYQAMVHRAGVCDILYCWVNKQHRNLTVRLNIPGKASLPVLLVSALKKWIELVICAH